MEQPTLQKIYSYEGTIITSMHHEGKLWLSAQDICDVLDITNAKRAASKLEESNYYVLQFKKENVLMLDRVGLGKLVQAAQQEKRKLFVEWVDRAHDDFYRMKNPSPVTNLEIVMKVDETNEIEEKNEVAEAPGVNLLEEVFKYGDQEVRTIINEDGNIWFVANDVCDILGIDKTQIRRLTDKQKGLYSIQTHGGKQKVSIVNEPGLYKLIFKSRKKTAEDFQEWVFEEVLPSIRKTGKYEVQNKEMVSLPMEEFLQMKEDISTIKEMTAKISCEQTKTGDFLDIPSLNAKEKEELKKNHLLDVHKYTLSLEGLATIIQETIDGVHDDLLKLHKGYGENGTAGDFTIDTFWINLAVISKYKVELKSNQITSVTNRFFGYPYNHSMHRQRITITGIDKEIRGQFSVAPLMRAYRFWMTRSLCEARVKQILGTPENN